MNHRVFSIFAIQKAVLGLTKRLADERLLPVHVLVSNAIQVREIERNSLYLGILDTISIGKFRIPGRNGANYLKPTKVRLIWGRNESTRAVAMVKHHCCAFNCKNSTQKQKNVEKYPELANVRFFSISSRQPK